MPGAKCWPRDSNSHSQRDSGLQPRATNRICLTNMRTQGSSFPGAIPIVATRPHALCAFRSHAVWLPLPTKELAPCADPLDMYGGSGRSIWSLAYAGLLV